MFIAFLLSYSLKAWTVHHTTCNTRKINHWERRCFVTLTLGGSNIIVMQARKCMALLGSWGEFRCPHTAVWTPLENTSLGRPGEYWLTLGVAAWLKDEIRGNPAFADTELAAFTEQQLEADLVYVR